MKRWNEDEVVQKLAAAQATATSSSRRRRGIRINSNDKTKEGHSQSSPQDQVQLPFDLLILARKFHRHSYEFVYYTSENNNNNSCSGNNKNSKCCSEKEENVDDLYNNTYVVLEDGRLSANCSLDGKEEDGEERPRGGEPVEVICTSGSSSSEDEDESEQGPGDDDDEEKYDPNPRPPRNSFKSYHVGKAMFHIPSSAAHSRKKKEKSVVEGPLLKVDGSPGWRQAVTQKYNHLFSQSLALLQDPNATDKQGRNKRAAKRTAGAAVVAAALVHGPCCLAMSAEVMAGGGAMAGGGTMAAGGSFTAAMQSIGAVTAMANPVGMTIAAAGAVGVGGVAVFYALKRKRKAKKKKEFEEALEALEKEVAQTALDKSDRTASTVEVNDELIPYKRLTPDDAEVAETAHKANSCVVLYAKRVDMEESSSDYCYVPSVSLKLEDAENEFMGDSKNTDAKALFSPAGTVMKVDTANPADHDGWSTALVLHYALLVEQGLLVELQELQDISARAQELQDISARAQELQGITARAQEAVAHLQ